MEKDICVSIGQGRKPGSEPYHKMQTNTPHRPSFFAGHLSSTCVSSLLILGWRNKRGEGRRKGGGRRVETTVVSLPHPLSFLPFPHLPSATAKGITFASTLLQPLPPSPPSTGPSPHSPPTATARTRNSLSGLLRPIIMATGHGQDLETESAPLGVDMMEDCGCPGTGFR